MSDNNKHTAYNYHEWMGQYLKLKHEEDAKREQRTLEALELMDHLESLGVVSAPGFLWMQGHGLTLAAYARNLKALAHFKSLSNENNS